MLTYRQNSLSFENQTASLLDQVGRYQSPTYIYDGSSIRHRARLLKTALPEQTEIFYALKANDHRDVIRLFISEGYGMDVVSRGEMDWCLENGCRPEKIIFSGVGKTTNEIIAALKTGIRQINVESLPELQRISEIAKQLRLNAPLGLRVNPDVDAKTHPYIATGLKNNKFGIDAQSLTPCQNLLKENPFLQFQGFSVHIGSQLTDLNACSEAYDKLNSIIDEWKKDQFLFTTLDAGGGLGIFYDRDDEDQESRLAMEWGGRLQKSWGHHQTTMMVEPGRWLVAHAGVLITRVEYIKETSHHRFAIVDTGMHHLLRPALYQAQHRIRPLIMDSSRTLKKYQVVGPICESSDVLATQVELPELQVGDLIAILDTGAYGRVMSSQYNRQPAPLEIFLP